MLITASIDTIKRRLLTCIHIHCIWSYLIVFPSFLLTYSSNECVSFQGIDPALSFILVQIFSIALLMPIILGESVLSNKYYRIYHCAAACAISIVQLIFGFIHLSGIINDGKGLTHTECFKVDFGGIYYMIFGNFIGAFECFLQIYYSIQYVVVTGSQTCCCFCYRNDQNKIVFF
eukprot:136024_1